MYTNTNGIVYITSWYVQLYDIMLRYTLWHIMISHVSSWQLMTNHIQSHILYEVTSLYMTSCNVVWRHITYSHIISHHDTLRQDMLFHDKSTPFIWPVTWRHHKWCDVTLNYVMWCHWRHVNLHVANQSTCHVIRYQTAKDIVSIQVMSHFDKSYMSHEVK